MKINPIVLGLPTSGPSIDKNKIIVGETTKLSLGTIEGVQLVGTYTPYKDEIVEVKADGTITGLSAGKTSIRTSDYKVSEESIKELVAAYSKKLGIETLTSDDLTFLRTEGITWVDIEVAANTGTTDSSNNKKTYAASAKTLPQTGESQTPVIITLGLIILGSSLILFVKKIEAD